MDITQWFLQHQLYIVIVYALVIATMAMYVCVRVRSISRISSHNGIKIFASALCLFAIGFYLQAIPNILSALDVRLSVLWEMMFFVAIIYFMTIASLYLVYSLSWKRMEQGQRWARVMRIGAFHLIAFILGVIGAVYNGMGSHAYFIVCIAASGYAAFLAYQNYKEKKERSRIAQLFFIAMLLWLIGYATNYLKVFFPQNTSLLMYTMAITFMIFVIFIYSLHSVFRKR